MFHNLCIGELIQHAGETSFECPNCRIQTEVDHSWQFPNLTETSQQTPEELPLPSESQSAAADPAVTTPVPSERGSEFDGEWQTPEGVESSFPWWPVPAHDESAKEEVPSYLSTTVRLADGNLGLLIDPGSYGNLCGQAWAEEAAKRAREQGYTAEFTSRKNPLTVGGVGKGSQTCTQDVLLPAVMERSDGSVQVGTYNAPVIQGSATPALLGLKSLREHRALLDISSGMLHLCAPGEVQLTLPPGSESFPLSSAPTGHFLLPFQDYARYTSASAKTAPSAIKHLFTEGNSPTGEPSSGAEASSSTVKVTIAAAVTETTEEASGLPEEPPASGESLPDHRTARPGVASVSSPDEGGAAVGAMYASEEVDEIPDAILTAIQEGTVASFSAKAAPPKAKPGKSQGTPGHVEQPKNLESERLRREAYAKAKAGALAAKATGAKAGVARPKTPPKARPMPRQPPPPPPARRSRCPNGHPLAEFIAPERGYICSVCNTAFGIHKKFMSCRPCDYDVCGQCFARQSIPPWRMTSQTVAAHDVPIVLTPRSDDAAMTEEGPTASGASSSARPITAFTVTSAQAGKAAAPKASMNESTTARPEGEEFVEVEVEPSEESDDPYANPANPPKAGPARRRRGPRRRRRRGGRGGGADPY